LLLFYALSQAGRVVAAARAGDSVWRLHGHGLRWVPAGGSGSVLERQVEPLEAGAFQTVAAATGSGAMTDRVELGALWSAIPDLMLPTPPGRKSSWPLPLIVWIEHEWESHAARLGSSALRAVVIGLRDPSSPTSIKAELQHYPTAADGVPESIPATEGPRVVTSVVPGVGEGPVVKWNVGRTVPERRKRTDEVALPYRASGARYALPRVGDQDFLSPLMLWWALLFGLSNLARYEPDTWVGALDVDRSGLALPIEVALDEALSAIPHLVLEALLDRHVVPHTYD
jgi:hypothetical protein